jgi:hypothetical protein
LVDVLRPTRKMKRAAAVATETSREQVSETYIK